VITVKLKGDYITEKHEKILNKLIKNNDVILIGPGISKNKKTLMFIRRLIEKCKKPKVIDADALKAINLKNIKNYIITPHHNEYGTILNNSNLREHELAKYIDRDIILLKGKVDRIISKEKTYLNRNGNSGMTVGGTGDILAGLCAGYLSQGYSKLESAKKAAYLNGKIGDKLKKRYGYGFIASDFLKEIAIENKKIKK
jgi:NAD(P)H-hydrate epimerase